MSAYMISFLSYIKDILLSLNILVAFWEHIFLDNNKLTLSLGTYNISDRFIEPLESTFILTIFLKLDYNFPPLTQIVRLGIRIKGPLKSWVWSVIWDVALVSEAYLDDGILLIASWEIAAVSSLESELSDSAG